MRTCTDTHHCQTPSDGTAQTSQHRTVIQPSLTTPSPLAPPPLSSHRPGPTPHPPVRAPRTLAAAWRHGLRSDGEAPAPRPGRIFDVAPSPVRAPAPSHRSRPAPGRLPGGFRAGGAGGSGGRGGPGGGAAVVRWDPPRGRRPGGERRRGGRRVGNKRREGGGVVLQLASML